MSQQGNLPVKLPDVQAFRAVLAENYEPGEAPAFLEIHSPGSGGRRFLTKGVSGVEEVQGDVAGIVLDQKTSRAYYVNDYTPGSDQAPDCASDDGITGNGDPGGPCSECPFNHWGSGGKDGRGKACGEYRKLFIQPIDGRLPFVLRVPPTGLGPWKAYRDTLVSSGRSLRQVVTSFGLFPDQSGATRVLPKFEGNIDKESVAAARVMAQALTAQALTAKAVDKSIADGHQGQTALPSPQSVIDDAGPHPAEGATRPAATPVPAQTPGQAPARRRAAV